MSVIVFLLYLVAAVMVLREVADRRNVSLPLLAGVFVAGMASAFGWVVFLLRCCL